MKPTAATASLASAVFTIKNLIRESVTIHTEYMMSPLEALLDDGGFDIVGLCLLEIWIHNPSQLIGAFADRIDQIA